MKKLLSLIVATLFATVSFAQVDEVTLTVIGTGPNEEQATLQALRSALEQTFGTFVSANTTIINDKMVRDEIAGTTRGNVKEYKKINVIKLPDNRVSVTLRATISVNKLISYARNNGSRAEFAGQTYMMNLKLLRLKKSNAEKVLDIMRNNILAMCKNVFDYDIQIGEIEKRRFTAETYYSSKYKSVYILPVTLSVYATDVTTNIYILWKETMNSLSLSLDEYKEFERNGIDYMPQEKIESIEKDIARAIVNDFLNVKIRKINDTEYYSFMKFDPSSDLLFSTLTSSQDDYDAKWYRWLYSNKTHISLTSRYVRERNCIECSTTGYPNIEEGGCRLFDVRSIKDERWNTKYGSKICQAELFSLNLCIPLTEQELGKFNGLELVGVSSPKYPISRQEWERIKKEAEEVKKQNEAAWNGYVKLKDFSPNTTMSIKTVRIMKKDLPLNSVKLKIECEKYIKYEFDRTFVLTISNKSIDMKDVDPSIHPFPVKVNKANTSTSDYIDFGIDQRTCRIKDIPEELKEIVYIKPK